MTDTQLSRVKWILELAKWTFPIISFSREPYEAKVSRTGLTGGMGRRTVRQRALCIPSEQRWQSRGYPEKRGAPLHRYADDAILVCRRSPQPVLAAFAGIAKRMDLTINRD